MGAVSWGWAEWRKGLSVDMNLSAIDRRGFFLGSLGRGWRKNSSNGRSRGRVSGLEHP